MIYRKDLVEPDSEGAWMTAGCVAERLGLEEFVERLRGERLI